MYKNENEIYADIISLCDTGLAWSGISGFTSKRAVQALNVNTLSPIILVTRLSSNQYGFQFNKGSYNSSTGKYTESHCFLQDLRFNIRGLKRRSGVQQTSNIFTSEDAVRGVMTYFQSRDGIKACANLGYSVVKPKENPEPFYISDSDQYEKSPSFDLLLSIVQSFDKITGKVSELETTIIPI